MLEESIYSKRIQEEMNQQSYFHQSISFKSLTDSKSKQFMVLTCSMTILYKTTKRLHNISCKFMFYKKGGYGFNFYKEKKRKKIRVFAIDYHPFWSKEHEERITRLHFHYGNGKNIKDHRTLASIYKSLKP